MKKLHCSIDRFEGDIAVIELGRGMILELDRSYLPEGARENDVFEVRFEKDDEAKDRRIKKIKALQQKLPRNSR